MSTYRILLRATRRPDRWRCGVVAATCALLPAALAPATEPVVVYSRNGSTAPYYAVWDYATESWGAPTIMSDVGKEPYWIVLKACPRRNELLCVTMDQDKDANIQFYDGCTWSAATEMCDDLEYDEARNVDAAYEQLSGDALIAYWDRNDDEIAYRTWDGSTLSGETLMGKPGGNKTRWVTLYPRPNSDEIFVVVRNDNRKTQVRLWDGTSWDAGWTELGSTAKRKEQEGYALAFESQSGTPLIVYDEDDTKPRYRTWNGASWSSEADLPDLSGKGYWIRLAADPASDEIICAVLDENHDAHVIVWNGTSWGAELEIGVDDDPREERHLDVAYEYGGNEALVVYFEKNKDALLYRTWDGSSWSAEQVGTDILSQAQFIQLQTSCCRTGEIFIAASDDDADVELLRWDGSSMSAKTKIEDDWGGTNFTEMFMIALPRLRNVLSWTEVAPP